MANKKVKMIMELDFISNKQSLESIKKDMDKLKQTVELNLDKVSADKLKEDINTLGLALGVSLNKSTGKINLKSLNTALDNNHLEIEKLNTSFRNAGIDGSKSFGAVGKANQYLQGELKNTNTVLDKMGYTLANTIRWNISSSAVNSVTGEFQKMYYFAKDLDRTLTNIRIVSGESANNMDRFAIAANKSAKELKVSTIAYAEAATLFYQQGLRGQDVLHMTEASIIGANITGQSAMEMSDLLTAVMRGYKIATEDVLTVTDKLAAVGANTAADFNELATGMSKVASMANAAGIDLDSLNAQLATIVSVTRESPESIGTSLKTIYGRMLMFKTDVDALMKDEDGEVFGAPNVEKALQAYNKVTGEQISLFRTTKDGKRELRDLGEVIEEIGNSWDKTTDKTAKFGIATALAGSRQQNRLVALFDSWNIYKDAMQTSLDAEGTSLKQNALYMESYAGRIEGLQAAKEELYMVFTNTDGLKDFISGLTKAVELVSFVAEKTGGIYGIIGLIGAALSKMATIKISDSLTRLEGAFQPKEKTADSPEARDAEKLHKIQRTYGLERAKMEREQLLNAKKIHLNHKIEQELLLDKRTNLERVNVLLEKRSMSESQRKGMIEQIKTENLELGISNDSIEQLIKSHDKLKIADVELKKARASFNEQGTRENAEKLQEASKRVKELREEIKEIHNDIEDNITRSGKNIETAKNLENKTQVDYDKLAKDADKLRGIITGVQTVMLTMPAIINAITDETKSGEEVLKTIATVSVPAILNGLLRHGPAILETVQTAGGLGAALSGVGLPIAAAVAGIALIGTALFKATREAKALDIALNNLEVTSEELEKVEQNYEDISKQLLDIKERRKEIKELNDNDDTTDEEKEALEEELELLDIKYGKLQEEQIIEEMLLQIAREKAELAAREAMEATMKSEYAYTLDGAGFEQKKDVTLTEELEHATEAFVEAEEKMTEYRKSLAELKLDENASAREIDKTQKALDHATKTRNKATDDIAEHSSSIRKIIKDLGDEEGANKELIKALQEYLDVSSKTIAKTLGVGAALDKATPEKFTDGMHKTSRTMKETIEQIDNFSKGMSTLDSAYTQLISNNQLTASNLSALQEQFGDIDGFENFIDVVGSATSVTSDVKEAFDSLVGSYLETSELMDALDEGNKDLIVSKLELMGVTNAEEIANELLANRIRELTAEQEALALEKEFVTEKGYNLIDATWEEIDAFINQENASEDTRKALAKLTLEKITLNNEKLDFNNDIDQIISLANAAGASAAALASLKNAKNILDGTKSLSDGMSGFHQYQDAEKIKKDVLSGKFDYQFTPLNANVYKKAVYGGGSATRKTGDRRSPGRSSGGSKEAEIKLVEADAYAKVNFEIEKQSVLLAQNKVDQDLARDNVEEKVSLMKEEIEIVKEQQKNYKELERIQLAQMKSLEEQLAKEGFKFKGEGAQREIKDLGHIEGKTEDVKKVFDEYIKLQNSELPKTKNEWKKFGLTITNIEESINSLYKKQLDDRISHSKNWIEHRMYYDDWGADNEISAWGRVRDYIQEYYNKGLINHQDYIDKMMEIDKNLEASQKRLWDTLKKAIETEKAVQLMIIEEDFRKQRDIMAKLRSDMERDVARVQRMIDREQSDIDRIQKSEAERRENEQRKSYLEDISKLQNKYYHLQYTGLENLTETQAELVGLEKERADQIERQNKLQEDQIKLDNLRRQKNIRQLIKGADGRWDFEYVADQKAIENLNKKIAKDQEEHEKSMDDLKKKTLESLKKRQEEFDEWERQNRIQRTIDEKQARIRRYQDEINDLQENHRKREEALEKQYTKEKEALDKHYKDIDEMTTLAMETLYDNYDSNWNKVTEMIKGYFKTITDNYKALKKELEGDIRMPNISGGGGGGSSGSSSTGSSRGVSVAGGRALGLTIGGAVGGSTGSIIGSAIGSVIGGMRKYHDGGIVGDSGKDLPEMTNQLFNLKPNEQIVKALKGELMIPEENISKNFIPNMQELVNSLVLPMDNIAMPKIPKVALSGASGSGDTIYYIDELNVPTNDFQSFIKDFTSVVENHPNKTIMKVKKIGGLR